MLKIWTAVAMTAFVAAVSYAQPKTADMSTEEWASETSVDRMTGRASQGANIWSRTKLDLPAPYQGAQPAVLSVGRDASGSAYALVGVMKGQFWCRDCDIRVRFDDHAVETWSANSSVQMSSFLNLRAPERFVARLRESKIVLIEAPFFKAGAIPLEFKAGGLPAMN